MGKRERGIEGDTPRAKEKTDREGEGKKDRKRNETEFLKTDFVAFFCEKFNSLPFLRQVLRVTKNRSISLKDKEKGGVKEGEEIF